MSTPGAAPASAASYTWTGRSTTGDWSVGADWEGEAAPAAGEEISALTFPVLTSSACAEEDEQEEEYDCYVSFNDLKHLTAHSMTVDGDDYFILGEALTLGAGGLTVSPPVGETTPLFDLIYMPFSLSATQTWSFPNRVGGKAGEAEILIEGPVTGPATSALTIDLSNAAEPAFGDGIETGPITIAGTDPNEAGVFNGAYPLGNTNVNGEDGQPVRVEHAFLFGGGIVGRLTSDDAELTVGAARNPAGGIEAASAQFDPATRVEFPIVDNGTTAQQDYGQLVSKGAIDLQGAALEVVVHPPEAGKPCPELTRGQTYTFVSTTGPLSGTFANAPESGPELPIKTVSGCASSSQTVRISYHESGPTQTVTGTIEEAAEKQQEAETVRLAEQRGKQIAEEAAKQQREAEAAKVVVQGVKEVSPDATIASTSLSVSSSGAFVVKVRCPAGEASCKGTITLRTLHAVSASSSGHDAKAKKAIVTLASGSFTVAGGQSKAVTLHLSAAGRKLLAHGHVLSARATIVAHNPTGGTHTGQTIVTLRPQKPKRH